MHYPYCLRDNILAFTLKLRILKRNWRHVVPKGFKNIKNISVTSIHINSNTNQINLKLFLPSSGGIIKLPLLHQKHKSVTYWLSRSDEEAFLPLSNPDLYSKEAYALLPLAASDPWCCNRHTCSVPFNIFIKSMSSIFCFLLKNNRIDK